MAKFAPGYPLPRSSDEFERLCLKLLRRHWQLPQLERFRDPERIEKGINLIEISGRPRLAAVKCDLCDGLPFMGCVHSCPTGAAIRIEAAELFQDIHAVTTKSHIRKAREGE